MRFPRSAPLWTRSKLDVFVTDNQGRFVRDLSRDDFEIVEDGRPQTIQSFSLVDLPADDAPATAPAPALSVPPDVHSNIRREGRLYVILMDSPSTHSPPGVSGGGTYTVLTRRVMREFVEQAVGPNDLVAVVHTHGTSTDAQTFTSPCARPS